MTPDMKSLCEAISDIDIGGALREVPIDDQYDALMLMPAGAEYIVRAVLMELLEGDNDENMINRIDRILAEPAKA